MRTSSFFIKGLSNGTLPPVDAFMTSLASTYTPTYGDSSEFCRPLRPLFPIPLGPFRNDPNGHLMRTLSVTLSAAEAVNIRRNTQTHRRLL